jgi:hypothetical protein
MSVPFMIVDGNLTVVLKSKSYQILKDHFNYKAVVEALHTADEDTMLNLIDVQSAVASFSDGSVEVKNGVVFYDGEEVHSTITKRLLEFMKNGLPFQPLVNFLKNLMHNPSMQSQRELYDFLEHENLPITEDGYFLAYKAVSVYRGESFVDKTGQTVNDGDFVDKYTGKSFRNNVGDFPSMGRSRVDDNRSVGCSAGLHVGSIKYVEGYASGDDKIVIVKIHPGNVVSVPSDENCQKVRVCFYEVVAEYQGVLNRPLYSEQFSYSDVEPEYEPDYDYEDEDEEDDPEDWEDEDEEEEDTFGMN